MNGMHAARVAVFALAFSLAFGGRARAQNDRASTVELRNHCRLAQQVLTTGNPSPHRIWALRILPRCGDLAGATLAELLRRGASTGAMPANWDSVFAALYGLQDATALAAAIEVATDPAASEQTRLMAIRVLYSIGAPTSYPFPQWFVSDTGTVVETFDASPPRGTPLPSDYRQRIASALRTVRADAGTPARVRQAADKVLMAVGR